jgi:hypothetical protein
VLCHHTTPAKVVAVKGITHCNRLRRAIRAVAAVSSVLCLAAYGADYSGRWMEHGIGHKSCGTFVRVQDGSENDTSAEGDRFAFISWAQGYLSHYNRSGAGVYDIYGGTDSAGIALWLYNYCRTNPLENFAEAVDALISALYPSRLIQAPR